MNPQKKGCNAHKETKSCYPQHLAGMSIEDWYDIKKEFVLLGATHTERLEFLLEKAKGICPFLDQLYQMSKAAKEIGEEEKATDIDADIYFWCLLFILGHRYGAWK